MTNTMAITALLSASLACLAFRGTADRMCVALVCTIVLIGFWAWFGAPRSSTPKSAPIIRSRSRSDFSFSLGEPEAPFLRVPDHQLDWFQTVVGDIFNVYDDRNARAICLKEPLMRLRKLVEPFEKEDWQLREPLDDVFLCRLLVAKDFNVEIAIALVKKYLEYRRDMDGGVRPPTAWINGGMISIPYEDRHGRPVVFVRGKYISNSMSEELMRSGYRSSCDAVIAHLLHTRGSRLNVSNPLEQYVLVFDADGMGWSNFTPSLAKVMVQESNSYYPERLARVFCINSTSFAHSCFKMVSPMLHPRTVKKMEFLPRDKVIAFMQGLVESEKLPKDFGGSAPSMPDPLSASTTKLIGPVMASVYRRMGVTIGDGQDDSSDERMDDEIPRSTGDTGGACCWRAW